MFQPIFVSKDEVDSFYEQVDINKMKEISKILYDEETGRIYFIEKESKIFSILD